MAIQNVIWDVDGILFDTYPAITYAISKSLNELGLSVAMNVIDGLVRRSFEGGVEVLCQRFKLEPDMLRRRFIKAYQTVPLDNQPPFPGIREVCELIHTHGGLSVIVTHRGIQSTQALLDAHGLAHVFDDVLSVEQGYPCKPNPAMVLAALDKHAMKPIDTLLVGARDLDIRAGRAAGIRTCLFGQRESVDPADFQIEDHRQLLSLLGPIS